MGLLTNFSGAPANRIDRDSLNVHDAVNALSGERMEVSNVLEMMIRVIGPIHALTNLLKLDDMGIYDDAIWSLFESCEKDYVRFSDTIKKEEFPAPIKSALNNDGTMRTDFFHSEIQYEIPSLNDKNIREYWSIHRNDKPFSVFVGQEIQNLKKGEVSQLPDAIRDRIIGWQVQNPEEALCAHVAWNMDELKDYDLGLENFTQSIIRQLRNNPEGADALASFYSMDEVVMQNISDWVKENPFDLSSSDTIKP